MQQRFPASSRRPLHPSTPTRLDLWVSLNNGWMLAKDADWHTRDLELLLFCWTSPDSDLEVMRRWCWLVFDTEGGLYPLGVNKTLLISRLLVILRKTLTIHFPDMVRFIPRTLFRNNSTQLQLNSPWSFISGYYLLFWAVQGNNGRDIIWCHWSEHILSIQTLSIAIRFRIPLINVLLGCGH